MKQLTQTQRLAKLLSRKRGATSMEICQIVGTVTPHRRLADLKQRGWTITRTPVKGENYGIYRGRKETK